MNDRSDMSRVNAQRMPARHITGLLFALLTAGCAGLERVPAGEADRKDATQSAVVAPDPVAAPVASTGEIPQIPTPAVAAVALNPDPKAAPSTVPGSTDPPAAKAAAPAATPTKVLAPPALTGQPSKKESPTLALAKSAGAPPLDMKSLETRLKETKGIGVFTKLALKNQVDDLLKQFRAYYQGQLKTTLAELRRPYEMLLLKVLALLQDSDPPLAGAIVASREAIWGILADPAKFASI